MCRGTNAGDYSWLLLDGRPWKIDACLAPLILQLNQAGVSTVGSCCGHGKSPWEVIITAGSVDKAKEVTRRLAEVVLLSYGWVIRSMSNDAVPRHGTNILGTELKCAWEKYHE